MRCLDRITDAIGMNLTKFWEMIEDRGVWHATVQGSQKVGLMTEQQHKWDIIVESKYIWGSKLIAGFAFAWVSSYLA